MPSSYPSVQLFYQREVLSSAPEPTALDTTLQGDGFTEEELAATQDPSSRKWNPEREYEELTIDKLVTGPLAVTFAGRVVNFNTCFGTSQKEKSAAGWHYLLIKDDTAAISIKLYFAHQPYPITLGLLLTIWTSFISEPSKSPSTAPTPSHITLLSTTLSANIFPGRVTSDHILLHTSESTDSICRSPLGYTKRYPLPGLMTLHSYINGGHDGISGIKLLVCIKSLSARKKIPRKQGGENELIELLLFDHTGEIRMTFWNETIPSGRTFKPSYTVLLITNPGFKVASRGEGSIGLARRTMVDVDPECGDAEWLRGYAEGVKRKESLCPPFPERVFDVEAAEYGINRMFFTLAELDTWVRSDPNQTFTGFINVTILEVSLVMVYRRNMLMCGECCGITTFSNTPQSPCPSCKTPFTLVFNPQILGPHPLVDETGSIDAKKLTWSPRAWTQLLDLPLTNPATDLCPLSPSQIQHLSDHLLGLRIHLVIGWTPPSFPYESIHPMKGNAGEIDAGIGRLSVLGVMS